MDDDKGLCATARARVPKEVEACEGQATRATARLGTIVGTAPTARTVVRRYRSRKLHRALDLLDGLGIAHGETRDEVYAAMRHGGWRWDVVEQRWRG